jgi:23S rRNA pseudouridine2605 synthase
MKQESINQHIIKARTGRIAKIIARAGICSRRDAERLIAERRVTLNGVIVESPAINVGETDTVCVDGKPVETSEPARLWRYHKRKGQITTRRDPQGRPTIFDALPQDLPRLISVGRLDFNTEGLLLLTNDGALSRHLELPATGWVRRYRVRVHGRVDPKALAALENGITIDGVRYGPIEARLEREQTSANAWLSVALREGKNREIRRIMEHLGLKVTRLIRVSFGPFQLGDLPEGAIEEVTPRVLASQLGDTLAKSLGLKPAAAQARVALKAKQRAGAATALAQGMGRASPGHARKSPRVQARRQKPLRRTP